jgi:hypothetical protein
MTSKLADLFVGLTSTESMSMMSACRLLSALQYKADNPGGDATSFSKKMGEELASTFHSD